MFGAGQQIMGGVRQGLGTALGAALDAPRAPQAVTSGPLEGLYPMQEVRQLARYPAALGSLVSSPFSAVMQGRTPTRVYHGTPATFEQFAAEHADPNGLYGPGFYFTENPAVASGYAKQIGMLPIRKQVPLEQMPQFLRDNPDAVLLGGGPAWKEMMVFSKPNVRPAFLDITKPFDVDATVSQETQRALMAPIQADIEHLSTFAGSGPLVTALRSRLAEMVRAKTNGELYGAATQGARGGVSEKEAVNAALQQAGFDGITHIGGKVTGGTPHRVWIAFHPKQIVPAFTPSAELP